MGGALLAQAGAVTVEGLEAWKWLVGIIVTAVGFIAREWLAGRKERDAKADLRASVADLQGRLSRSHKENDRLEDVLQVYARQYGALAGQVTASGEHLIKIPEPSGVRKINSRESSSAVRRP